MFRGQAEQDKFVVKILQNKKNGTYVELGTKYPIHSNNTYILESKYDWRGILIEYKDKWINDYKKHRPNSNYVIKDASKIDYKQLFLDTNMPNNIDYLQIDLEVDNGSTLNSLKKIENDVMKTYKFATITFEHDIYKSNYLDTRNESRKIFKNNGYIRVFSDINNKGIKPFEDWYVHPDLVDMDYVNKVINKNETKYKQGIYQDNYYQDSKVDKSINWQDIEY